MARRLTITVLAYVLFVGASVDATTYTVVILHPSGFTQSQAMGIADGQQVGYGWGEATGGEEHALLWSGSATSWVDLNPPGASSSRAQGVSNGQQVGEAWGEGMWGHAMLWSGSAESFVDLHPPGDYVPWSAAWSISDGHQVGGGYFRALLWSDSAGSYVDLTPVNSSGSAGLMDCSGDQLVGAFGYGEYGHAALWLGYTQPVDVVDLNPDGIYESGAYAISGSQQAGCGRGPVTEGYTHALLWSGTAASCVDLHPSGFDHSIAWDIAGGFQVGCATVQGSYTHALVWAGTAEDYIDLHSFLPAGYTDSYAQGIDATGKIVGYATQGSTGYSHAVMWVPTIDATMTIDPDPLRLRNSAPRVTCSLSLPSGFSVANIVRDGILLQGQVRPTSIQINAKKQVATVKFDLSPISNVLVPGQVPLKVTGTLANGTRFEGVDTITVKD